MVMGLPFWVWIPLTSPHFSCNYLFLWVLSGLGVVLNEVACLRKLSSLTSLVVSSTGDVLLSLASLYLLSWLLTRQTTLPYSLTLACPFFLIFPILASPCMAAVGLVFPTSLWEMQASSLSQLAAMPRPVQLIIIISWMVLGPFSSRSLSTCRLSQQPSLSSSSWAAECDRMGRHCGKGGVRSLVAWPSLRLFLETGSESPP